MAKWDVDKLCRPKKYMGQIMAECDCQSKLCERRGYCMAETPSPEAIIHAALEKAQEAIRQDARDGDLSDGAAQWTIDTIRSFADDPAEVAAIIKRAGEDRG